MTLTPQEKTRILVQALPYIRQFRGKTLVIKYGGSAMEEESLRDAFAEDVTFLNFIGIRTIVVHGGGPQIREALELRGKESEFVMGLRVTDAETMDVVSVVLGEKINKDIVNLINTHGGQAVGLSGADGGALRARKLSLNPPAGWKGKPPELGMVGEVTGVDTALLGRLGDGGFVPVVAPLGVGEDGLLYNINADSAAGSLAAALGAEKLVYLTDVVGVQDNGQKLISALSKAQVKDLQSRGVISGGMIPKVGAGLRAIEAGVKKTHVIDGRIPHALLLEIFTDEGIGTEIVL